MPRLAANVFIALYLTAMSLGVASYAFKFGNTAHPIMYFFVWDMFSGWNSHEIRYHVLGEGESGEFYQLSPAPWSKFKPYGDISRHHYDALGNSLHKMAVLTLKHTQHEPMRRILVFEECWPKKYNLSPALWSLRYSEPRDPTTYCWLRQVHTPDGELQAFYGSWTDYQYSKGLTANPRLIADSRRGKPLYSVDTTAWKSEQPNGTTRWEVTPVNPVPVVSGN